MQKLVFECSHCGSKLTTADFLVTSKGLYCSGSCKAKAKSSKKDGRVSAIEILRIGMGDK